MRTVPIQPADVRAESGYSNGYHPGAGTGFGPPTGFVVQVTANGPQLIPVGAMGQTAHHGGVRNR